MLSKLIDEKCLKAYRRAFHEWKGREMQGQQDRLLHALEAYEAAKPKSEEVSEEEALNIIVNNMLDPSTDEAFYLVKTFCAAGIKLIRTKAPAEGEE